MKFFSESPAFGSSAVWSLHFAHVYTVYIHLYNIRKTCCFLTSTYLISTFLYSLSETSCQVVAGFFSVFSCTSRGDFLPHLRTQHLPRHSISRYHQENITDKTYKTIFRANPLCLTGNILNMYSCFPPPPEIRKQHLLPIPCCRWPCRWPWWWPWRRPRRWPGRRWPQGRWPRRGGPRCTEGGWSWAWPCRKERLVRHWHWDVQNLQHGPL